EELGSWPRIECQSPAHFSVGAKIAHDHVRARCHRLEGRDSRSLIFRWKHEEVGVRVIHGQRIVRDEAALDDLETQLFGASKIRSDIGRILRRPDADEPEPSGAQTTEGLD